MAAPPPSSTTCAWAEQIQYSHNSVNMNQVNPTMQANSSLQYVSFFKMLSL